MESVALVCVVTGGSKGIGRSIISSFLSQSYIVYNLDTQPPETSSNTAVTNDTNEATFLCTDVSQSDQLAHCLERIYHDHGRLNVLVNNAGVFETLENQNVLWEQSHTTNAAATNVVNQILHTNLESVIHGTRIAVQLMKKTAQSTCIVNIASTAALAPFPNHPVYGCTKAAILYFSQTANTDLQKDNISVYCICPGIVDTEMGRMGGERNALAVAAMKGGKRTSPNLVATAVLNCVQGDYASTGLEYVLVDDHEIHAFYTQDH